VKQLINSITIGIGVNDLKQATDWYKALLGDVETLEPAPGMFELKLSDNAWLQLDETGYLEVGGKSSILRLETTDIDASFQMVQKLTADVNNIETVEGVVKYFDFKDPAGNLLSFYQMI
jgi:catechol 2,3-dioxygenase-like lactoylglutathione lyase family enzyme